MRFIGIVILIFLISSCIEKSKIISEKKEIIINKGLQNVLFDSDFGDPIDLSKSSLYKGGGNNANIIRRLKSMEILESQNTRDYKDSLQICYCYLLQDTLNIHIERSTGTIFEGLQFQILNNKIENARIRLSSDFSSDTTYSIEYVKLELKDLKTSIGDTLFGKIRTEGKGGWQGYKYDETTEGYFKCIINKK